MLKKLVKLSNHLDLKGLTKEADYLDQLISVAYEEQKLLVDKSMSGNSKDEAFSLIEELDKINPELVSKAIKQMQDLIELESLDEDMEF
jgi:hypothetical protein